MLKIIRVKNFRALINFRGSVRSSKFFCVKCFIRVLNFRGWSQPRKYFNSEIFPIYGIDSVFVDLICEHLMNTMIALRNSLKSDTIPQ